VPATRVAVTITLFAASFSIFGQNYPSRAARIVVPWTPGGTADLLARLAGQKFSESFENIVVSSPYVKSGRIKALAVTSAKRAAALPAVPTIAESGVPGFEAVGWFGMAVPAATPKEIIAKLNSELVRVLAMPDIRERISSLGAEVVSTTPEGMDQFNRAQIALWARVVKASGAKVE
jgi:tripartite-type tricarboxylate transporter receptor subunit TctC